MPSATFRFRSVGFHRYDAALRLQVASGVYGIDGVDVAAVHRHQPAVWDVIAAGQIRRTVLVKIGRAKILDFGLAKISSVHAEAPETGEDTAGPAAVAGTGELAFLVGPKPRRMIALASISNGRITRRIPFDKGVISALAGTPDGKTLFCSADGVVWSISLAGGDPKKIRAGNAIAVDSSGENLFVQLIEPTKVRLVRVPLNGGVEQEIPLNGTLHLGDPAILSCEQTSRRCWSRMA